LVGRGGGKSQEKEESKKAKEWLIDGKWTSNGKNRLISKITPNEFELEN